MNAVMPKPAPIPAPQLAKEMRHVRGELQSLLRRAERLLHQFGCRADSLNHKQRQAHHQIIQAIAAEFGVSESVFFLQDRSQPGALMRQIAMTLLLERTDLPKQTIVELFGRGEPSTANFAQAAIRAMIETDHKFAARIQRIKTQLEAI